MNLLRAGRIFTFEPPPGVKANLIRTFNTIPASRMMKAPNERARLYLLLAWFHAIVQERLRYCPLGKLKFIYSEKVTKFCEIFPLLLTTVHTVKSKGKFSQNFVAFSEYMNFNGFRFTRYFVFTNLWKYR